MNTYSHSTLDLLITIFVLLLIQHLRPTRAITTIIAVATVVIASTTTSVVPRLLLSSIPEVDSREKSRECEYSSVDEDSTGFSLQGGWGGVGQARWGPT